MLANFHLSVSFLDCDCTIFKQLQCFTFECVSYGKMTKLLLSDNILLPSGWRPMMLILLSHFQVQFHLSWSSVIVFHHRKRVVSCYTLFNWVIIALYACEPWLCANSGLQFHGRLSHSPQKACTYQQFFEKMIKTKVSHFHFFHLNSS